MTRTTNARLAGVAFLLYIAVGLTSLSLFGRATGGADGTAAVLANLAANATLVRITVLLSLVTVGCALVLGITLYALTRDQDRDLALIALWCRGLEGAIGAVGAVQTLGLLSIAADPDPAAVAVGGFLLDLSDHSVPIAALSFAVGSTIFSWLFLKARSVPAGLAWLGVVASVLLVVVLPLRIAGLLPAMALNLSWIPMAVFEVALALWLIVKGAAVPRLKAS